VESGLGLLLLLPLLLLLEEPLLQLSLTLLHNSNHQLYLRRLQPRVSDPDWTRIESGQWIRIRIRNPDPDPGGQKIPTKVEKY
jgi:hypothetical protein